MAKMYITFGQVHVHSVNGRTFDKDCVACFDCENYADGRAIAFEIFGPKFHNSYFAISSLDDEFTDDILKYFPRGVINV